MVVQRSRKGDRYGNNVRGQIGRLPEPNGSVCTLSDTAKTRYTIFMMKNEMTSSVKDEILSLIAQADAARESALSDENRQDLGYPFVAGYTTQTLKSIERIVANL